MTETRENPRVMNVRRIELADGRYLIYYEFERPGTFDESAVSSVSDEDKDKEKSVRT